MRQHIKNALLIKKEGSNNMGFLAVGMGGGIGAMLRYAISMIPYKHTFPQPDGMYDRCVVRNENKRRLRWRDD